MGLAANAGSAVGMLAAGLLSAPLGLSVVLNVQALLYLAAGAVAAAVMVGRRETTPRSATGLLSAPDV
jgi:hypothetical protein